jgi:hypothetical protein
VKRIPVLSDEEVIVHGELVVMTPVSRTPFTKARFARTYKPAGPALAPYQRVYSVGLQASDAIQSLGDKIGWGKLDNFHFEDVAPGTGKLGDQWYATFTADGTSMKAGGRFMPGGVILDWWK